MDNAERAKILEEEVNKYFVKVGKLPLYPVDRYRLVHYCLTYLDNLGYKYDINSRHILVIVNYYHTPDIKSLKNKIEALYAELSSTINGIGIYDTDRQNILFQFREMIFKIGIKATYYMSTDNLILDVE